jgi:hypothetical protein
MTAQHAGHYRFSSRGTEVLGKKVKCDSAEFGVKFSIVFAGESRK